MRNKRIIVTLLAAATIALAVMYTMMNMGGQHPGKRPDSGNANMESPSPQTPHASNRANEGRFPENEMGKRQPNSGNLPSGAGRNNNAPAAPNTTLNQTNNATLAQVGVVEVTASSYNAVVRGYGQVTPQDSLSLVAQVSGQVMQVSPSFKTGVLVPQNTVLASIDDTSYRQALASATSTYQSALVSLEEERLQGAQAQDEWQRSGLDGKPLSDLVLREPQFKAAQAALDEAQQSVNSAKRDLTFTMLSAPFNALVVSRDISLGSFVQAGSAVATLYSANMAEVAIGLSPSQWARLPAVAANNASDAPLNWPVTLKDTTTGDTWQANIVRAEWHQDDTTRQRNAIAVIENPLTQHTPLLFGSFVHAEIKGKALQNVWKIPASAVSQKQEVWLVLPAAQTLVKFTPNVLFENDGYAYITPPRSDALTGDTGQIEEEGFTYDLSSGLVVARPLNSYLVSTKVVPVIEGRTGGEANDQ